MVLVILAMKLFFSSSVRSSSNYHKPPDPGGFLIILDKF